MSHDEQRAGDVHATDSCDVPFDAQHTTGLEPRASWDRPWLILGLLFFVTLFLGLPFVWISRSFSRPMKLMLTLVVMLYSALVLWLFYLVMAWCYSRISDALT